MLLGGIAAVVIALGVTFALIGSAGSNSGKGHKNGRNGTVAAMRVLSMTPAAGSHRVDGSAPVLIQFSAPLAAGSPRPLISPAVPGTWRVVGNDLAFDPARPFLPHKKFTVTVPAGRAGVRTAAGGLLASPLVAHFTTTAYSQLRLSQLLAQLGYLPMSWSQSQTPAVRAEEHVSSASQAALAFDPPVGTFTWQGGYPAQLAGMWRPGRPNVLLAGAVMAFESQHRMPTNGALTPRFWSALFRAAAHHQRNGSGYTYAVASKSSPETLTIWHNGHVVLRSAANTGIPVSPTVDGTFPVFQRYRFQIMRGTNPDGSSYADPVSFVSYFNGGDAVHYFPRGSYGSPQSLGCVELPYTAARQAYPYLTYGSLVTVTG
jgi:lipoprotein-anchoring transpeptidase ErfK/SrfK